MESLIMADINTTDVTNDKTFWRTFKPFFTDKITIRSKIILFENKEVQKKDKEKVMIKEVISNETLVSFLQM